MDWYTILGLCLGILSLVFMNIWLNRRKWKKLWSELANKEWNQADFDAAKEAFGSLVNLLPQIQVLLGQLKKEEEVGE